MFFSKQLRCAITTFSSGLPPPQISFYSPSLYLIPRARHTFCAFKPARHFFSTFIHTGGVHSFNSGMGRLLLRLSHSTDSTIDHLLGFYAAYLPPSSGSTITISSLDYLILYYHSFYIQIILWLILYDIDIHLMVTIDDPTEDPSILYILYIPITIDFLFTFPYLFLLRSDFVLFGTPRTLLFNVYYLIPFYAMIWHSIQWRMEARLVVTSEGRYLVIHSHWCVHCATSVIDMIALLLLWYCSIQLIVLMITIPDIIDYC